MKGYFKAKRSLTAADRGRLDEFKRRFIANCARGANSAAVIRKMYRVRNGIYVDVDFAASSCRSLEASLRGGLNSKLGKGTF